MNVTVWTIENKEYQTYNLIAKTRKEAISMWIETLDAAHSLDSIIRSDYLDHHQNDGMGYSLDELAQVKTLTVTKEVYSFDSLFDCFSQVFTECKGRSSLISEKSYSYKIPELIKMIDKKRLEV